MGMLRTCVLICWSLLWVSLSAEHPEQSLLLLEEFRLLSQEDREVLRLFFHDLFVDSELGYTLFGDKPMSFTFLDSAELGIFMRGAFPKVYQRGCYPFYHAWKVWNQLKNKNENFIFLAKERLGVPLTMFFINRKEFVKIVDKNLLLFQNVYGAPLSGESFLEELETKRIDPQSLFKQHLILGILLGYGTHNAKLFDRRHVIMHGDPRIPHLKGPTPSPGFKSLDEEFSYLDERLERFYPTTSLFTRVCAVCCTADFADPETIELKKKYTALHHQLIELVSQDQWMEEVLKLLSN